MKKILYLLIITLLIMVIFCFSMILDQISLTTQDVVKTFIGQGNVKSNFILLDIRLPRFLIVCLIGAALTISGIVFQAITQNDLAEPGLIGVNSGSILFIILGLLFFKVSMDGYLSMLIIPIFSFVGGIVVAILMLMVLNKHTSNNKIILYGLAINSFFSAIITILLLKLNESQLNFFISFSAGTVYGTQWIYVYIMTTVLVIVGVLIYRKYQTLNILLLNEESARGLGLLNNDKLLLLIYATILSATSVSIGGGISIVGLIVPHISRKIVGGNHQILIPFSIFIGILFVSMADMFSQYVLSNNMPTGILLILLCTPYLIYHIINQRRYT